MTTKEERTEWGKVWYIDDEDGKFRFAVYVYDDDPTSMMLANVKVEPQYRGEGFGNIILSMAEDIAKSMDCNKIFLKCRRDNSFAKLWYERHGYKEFIPDVEDSLCVWMKKEIQ